MKIKNIGGHFRCSICNKVSLEDISTEIGDYKRNLPFVHDPKDPMHFICIDCMEVIEDQRQDYHYLGEEE
jgi:hypothetical protein